MRSVLKINKTKNSAGFSLVELLVAMACFSIVIMAVVDIFIIGLGGGQRALGFQNVQDSARFMLEVSTKEIRMSEIQEAIDDAGDVYTIASLATGFSRPYKALKIKNYKGVTVIYTFNGTQFIRDDDGAGGASLNPNNLSITGHFYIRKQESSGGAFPPSVVVSMSVANVTGREAQRVQLDLETTVSSRRYDLAK